MLCDPACGKMTAVMVREILVSKGFSIIDCGERCSNQI